MNVRQSFLDTMIARKPICPPLFDEGIRDGVLEIWHQQGMPEDRELSDLFKYDRREEISLDLLPDDDFYDLINKPNTLELFRRRFDEQVQDRMPDDWQNMAPAWNSRNHTLMLMVHWGFLEAIGIEDGRTFAKSIYLMADKPDLIKEIMMITGQAAAGMLARLLEKTSIDAAIFSEPIGGNHGALISPETYKEFALPGYQPILDALKENKVETIIWRTYANTRNLLAPAVEAGMNCLWACETNPNAMDYLDIREQFGANLRLIGGIDLDVLRLGSNGIKKELDRVLPPLLDQGGYIPLADGRVREDIPYQNYQSYRNLLEEMVNNRY